MPTSIFAERSALSPSAVIPAGGGTGLAGIGGVLTVNTTQTQTGNNTNETDLATYSLPANTLNADGYSVRITAFGSLGANGNNKTVRVKFAGTTIVQMLRNVNGGGWHLTAEVIRTGSATQVASGTGLMDGVSGQSGFAAPTGDTTGAIAIAVTGQNGTSSAGDIVFRGLIIELLRPAA